MKSILIITAAVLLSTWLAGFFVIHFPAVLLTLLIVSVALFIRSLFTVVEVESQEGKRYDIVRYRVKNIFIEPLSL